jgi:uncharacterized protein (DUF58 family)
MGLTSRGWWTSACGLISLACGVAIGSSLLSLVGLITLGFMLANWLLMAVILKQALNRLKFQASFSESGPLRIGQPLQLELCLDGLNHPLSSLLHLEPVTIGRFSKSVPGPSPWELASSGRWECTFSPIPSHLGRAGLLGLGFVLQDPAGWFVYRGFLPWRLEKPVLAPVIAPRASPKSSRKETNVLSRPGLFLHEKPGQSMEFLGLRDFQSGDSSRRVSWKASLRRDRVLVRETEWEVPCVIQCLVDAGEYNRRENPQSKTVALGEMAVLTGQLLRQVLDHGNPGGLALVSESDLLLEPPGLGPSHLLRAELAFAKMATRPVRPDARLASILAPWADGILGQMYPDLMDPSTNRLPFWYSWLEGFPANPSISHGQSLTFAERLDGGRFWFWLAGPLGWLMLPFVFSLTDQKRRIGLARKRVASALSSLLPLPPGALEKMLQDDAFFVKTTVSGLSRLGIDSIPLLSQDTMVEPELQIGQGRRLAKALLGRLALARDHQVFVVILCASRIAFGLAPLLDALKRCVARGHRVLVWDIASSTEVVEGKSDFLQSKVTKDLSTALVSAGVGYWYGTPEEIMARWNILFRKDGLLGTKRKS